MDEDVKIDKIKTESMLDKTSNKHQDSACRQDVFWR
jgi:hypothetical protein